MADKATMTTRVHIIICMAIFGSDNNAMLVGRGDELLLHFLLSIVSSAYTNVHHFFPFTCFGFIVKKIFFSYCEVLKGNNRSSLTIHICPLTLSCSIVYLPCKLYGVFSSFLAL